MGGFGLASVGAFLVQTDAGAGFVSSQNHSAQGLRKDEPIPHLPAAE